MTPEIAVAHYPEGAGHATRMLAVAKALERGGATVRLAGGGAGTVFVERNGYEEYEPTPVDYIDTYQGGSLRQVFAESVPKTASRVTDYIAWLRETEPDALLTDDMFAAMAALRTDVPLYVLKHDVPALYDDRVERAGATFHTVFQHAAARDFFYPTVWPLSASDPEGVTRVPPVALDGDAHERGSHDVVVVPSHYSELDRIADVLERQGLDVVDVGSDEWDAVPSLLPYIRQADVVVCSGYSTVMDAAVAGTPCVVHPATDEQAAVGDWIERFDVDGFTVAEEPLDVVEAVASPPDAPAFENGAAVIADAVLDDLAERAPDEATAGPGGPGEPGESDAARPDAAGDDGGATAAATGRIAATARGAADRAVAATAAVGTALRASVLRGRRYAAAAGRTIASGATALARRIAAACRRVLAAAGSAAAAVAGRIRATGAGCRRYAAATAAVSAAVVAFTRGTVRARARRTRRGLAGGASAVASAVGRCAGGVATAARAGADGATSLADRAASLGAGLKRAVPSSE
ncbi:hypothetical protein [Halomicrobium salinisoli]|uniref:glycosyltransferase n=1 Tax=Halomicrobium salinisoli TaxID=2878391 RepID=UPI0030842310